MLVVSFFFIGDKPKGETKLSKFLTDKGCSYCPMNKVVGLMNPKMHPTGSDNPDVYILGEAPGREEDFKGEQFVGDSGKILRNELEKYQLTYRFNNTIRCHPENNRDPVEAEIECCRGYIVEDIEKTKPLVILGTGNIPLSWSLNETGILKWRGKIVPVKIGNHICWYMPITHPSFILRNNPKTGVNKYLIKFKTDIEKLYKFVTAYYQSPSDFIGKDKNFYSSGISIFMGDGDIKALLKALSYFDNKKLVAVDIETSQLRPYYMDSKILTISISDFNKTVCFPISFPGTWKARDRIKLNSKLVKFFSNRVVHFGTD